MRDGKQLKILIADDEPLMRQLLISYLPSEYQYRLFDARDGLEALSLYAEHYHEIDIIFLDIEMPKVDGLRVLKEIRSVNPVAYVVIISGFGTMDNVKTAIKAGVNGFIAKPYSRNKIAEALNNYLRHSFCKY